MPMFCAECKRGLDHVAPEEACPDCGGHRRHAYGTATLIAAPTMTIGAKVGYTLAPGWTYQWRGIQHHLARLREQYGGARPLGNIDVEQTVHALFLDLYHLCDWLYQDSALPALDQSTVRTFIDRHPNSLGVCRDYANTRKHMKRDRPNAQIAQIASIEYGPGSYKVLIGYGTSAGPFTEVDALALAERCEQDWRDLLTQHGIAMPT